MDMNHKHAEMDMKECIRLCTECHNTCLALIPHCLEMGGEHASVSHQRMLMDCAEACQTSANFMLRGSQLHTRTCGVCAEACERCATDCERLANGDEHMLACARICRECATECRTMASQATHH